MSNRVLFYLTICFVLLSTSVASGADLTREKKTDNETELQKIRSYSNQYSTPGGLSNLFTPLIQPSQKMKTMDGKTSFQADIACSSEATLVKVSATPSGSLSATGELDISIAYDFDYDGVLDHMFVMKNVAGACINGAILNCSPAGSWTNCKYGLMEFNSHGEMSLPTKYPSGEDRAPQGLTGCFCFSKACGGYTLEKMEQILTTYGIGVLNEMRKRNPEIMVSKTFYDQNGLTYYYYGSKTLSCNEMDANLVNSRSGLYGELFFPYQTEMAQQEADKSSPWSLIKEHVINKVQEFTCTNRAMVAFEQIYANEWVTLEFGIGHDVNGSSKQCYTFYGDACGPAYLETGNTQACQDWVIANRLGDVCARAYLPSGYFSEIKDVRNFHFTSGFGKYVDCYGSGDNPGDMKASIECAGKKLTFQATCQSPSMGQAGKVILNDPYEIDRYQGCYKIIPYQNGCAEYASRSDCRVTNRVRDGYYLVREGVSTGQNPPRSCRTLSAQNRTITVCEPWWEEKVTYECENKNEGWEKEKLRAQAIGEGTKYSNGEWISQGDIGFNADGSTYKKSVLAGISFMTSSDKCIPACLVAQTYASDQIYLPEQGKIAADGGYHVENKESSYVSQGTISLPEVVECEQKNGRYVCPVGQNQVLQYDCTCSNAQEFIQAIVSLSAISQASTDFICSTGVEHGQCISSTEEEESNYRVVCNKNDEGLVDCNPVLWTGNQIPPQEHIVTTNDEYQCIVPGKDAQEEDFAFSILKPVVDWFQPKMDWAKDIIVDYLIENSDSFVTEGTGNGCTCDGTDTPIDVCYLRNDAKYLCLTSNATFATKAECASACKGKATNSPGKGLCLWKTPEIVYDGVSLLTTNNLNLNIESEKVFGDIEFSTTARGMVYHSDGLAHCEDRSVYDTIKNTQQTANCTYSLKLIATSNTVPHFYSSSRKEPDCEGVWCDTIHYIGTGTATFKTNSYGYSSVAASVSRGIVIDVKVNNVALVAATKKPTGLPSLPCTVTVAAPHCWVITNGNNPAYPKSDQAQIQAISGKKGRYVVTTWHLNTSAAGQEVQNFIARIYQETYTCSLTGNVVEDNSATACNNQCKKTVTTCTKSGKVVTKVEDCHTYDFRCVATNIKYSTMATCNTNCSTASVVGLQGCIQEEESELTPKFSYYLTPNAGSSFGMDSVVSYISPEGDEVEIGRTAYENEQMILGQCVTDYTEPYINFDEPGTNAHFEYSHIDQKIFDNGVLAELFPKHPTKKSLPSIPPVYSGTAARELQIWENRNLESISIGDGPLVPTERILQLLENKVAIAPRIPMFWGKQTDGIWNEDQSSRLGVYKIIATNLTPRVFYYECPNSNKTKGNLYNCGSDGVFGGLAQTINGSYCFQYYCDADAVTEETTEILSGCGMINDGRFQ